MDRYTIISAGVAAALHGGLLFGFNRGPVPAVESVPPPSKDVVLIVIPPVTPEPEIVTAAPSPRGQPDLVPRSAEAMSTGPAVFEMPVNPLPAVELTNVPQLPTTPPGVPDGVGDDLRRTIVGSVALDNEPRTRVQVAPQYPHAARTAGRTGEVTVEFVVDEGGNVLDPRVVRSTDRDFEEPTLRAIARWRFVPGRVQGQVVRFRMSVPVVFNLQSD